MSKKRLKNQQYIYGNTVKKNIYKTDHNKIKLVKINNKINNKITNLVSFVSFITALFLLSILHLNLQSGVTKSILDLKSINNEYLELKTENNDRYNYIENNINLIDIRETALNEYGMTYATSEQVVGFKAIETNYVKQYSNIQ